MQYNVRYILRLDYDVLNVVCNICMKARLHLWLLLMSPCPTFTRLLSVSICFLFVTHACSFQTICPRNVVPFSIPWFNLFSGTLHKFGLQNSVGSFNQTVSWSQKSKLSFKFRIEQVEISWNENMSQITLVTNNL